MPTQSSTQQALLAENAELRARLEEAEEMLRAIHSGEVDALVVKSSAGPQVFTLQGLDAELNRFRGEILEQVSDAVIVLDDDHYITYLNAAAAQQYNVTASQALGCHITKIYQCSWYHPGDEAAMLADLSETGTWRGEKIHIKCNGETIHVEISTTRLHAGNGTPHGLLAVIRDITERKINERLLVESQQRYAGIVESAMDAIITIDADQHILLFNTAAEKMFGCTADEAIGGSLERFIPARFRQIHGAHTLAFGRNHIMKRNMSFLGCVSGLRASGEEFPVEVSISHAEMNGGKLFTAILRDDTERQHMEENLRGSEANARARQAELETLMDTIPAAIFFAHDAACQQITGNPCAMALLRVPHGSNLSASASNIELPEYEVWRDGRRLAPEELPMQRAAATGQALSDIESEIVFPDGGKRYTLGSAVPLFDDSSAVRGCVGVFLDITERKHRERNYTFLTDMQKELSMLSSAMDIMRVMSERIANHLGLAHCLLMEIKEAADECTVLYDHHAAEEPNLEGVYRIRDFHAEDERQLLKSGGTLVINDVRQDLSAAGRIEQFEALGIGAVVNASYVADGQWKFVLSAERRAPYVWPQLETELLTELAARIYVRIERARTEAALQESEERWRFALQASNLGAWELDPEHRVAWRSSRHDLIFGYAELLPEWTYDIFLQHVLEEDRGNVNRCFQQVTADHKDLAFECRIRRADGLVRWIWVHGKSLDETGEHLFGLVGDITERKQTEQALKDADQRKDEFLAMLAHELRNPLVPILNAVQILNSAGSEDSRIMWCSDIINRQAKHLTRMVNDLLEVSRIAQGKIELNKESLTATDFILPAIETSRPLMEARQQELSLALPKQPLWVNGDRVRLTQVISNLLNNASKFTAVGGHIGLTAEECGNEVCIHVNDTGCGIESSVLPNLFELFYQVDCNLARSQGGLGIGLSLVHNLVKMHDGNVQAFSAGLGQGSEFVVCLPMMKPTETATDFASTLPASINGELCILVVDDYPSAAESLAMLLELKGHQVWIAHDGLSAIEMALAKQPRVVILDIGLPDMDGFELATKLRQCTQLGEMLIIALSGYAPANNPEKLSAAGFDEYLVKPVKIEVIQKLLEKIPGVYNNLY